MLLTVEGVTEWFGSPDGPVTCPVGRFARVVAGKWAPAAAPRVGETFGRLSVQRDGCAGAGRVVTPPVDPRLWLYQEGDGAIGLPLAQLSMLAEHK